MCRQRLLPSSHAHTIGVRSKIYCRDNVGYVSSLYLMPYIYKRTFLDTLYGILKVGDIFKIGDIAVVVDTDGDITIRRTSSWVRGSVRTIGG